MNSFQHIDRALTSASIDTSRFLTARLRSETRASGWPDEVTRHMSVHFDGDFHVHSHPSHKDQVHNLEYGTPDTQPTAAIRRFANRTHEAEKFLVGRMHKMVGKL